MMANILILLLVCSSYAGDDPTEVQETTESLEIQTTTPVVDVQPTEIIPVDTVSNVLQVIEAAPQPDPLLEQRVEDVLAVLPQTPAYEGPTVIETLDSPPPILPSPPPKGSLEQEQEDLEILAPFSDTEGKERVAWNDDTPFRDVVAIGTIDYWNCSGVLLGSRTVLTARHCLPATHVATGDAVQRLRAVVPVAALALPPTPNLDLALLFLATPLEQTHHPFRISPTPPEGLLLAVGFGATNEGHPISAGVKRKVSLYASGWGCDGNRAYTTGCKPGLEMVLPSYHGNDTCRGDSGGPVFETLDDGSMQLVGIVSRPIRNARQACGDGGIYTRVDAAAVWILKTLKQWRNL